MWIASVPNFNQIVQEMCTLRGRNLFMHLSVAVTQPIFTTLIHAIQLFADNAYIKFYKKNPENGLGFDPRPLRETRKNVVST